MLHLYYNQSDIGHYYQVAYYFRETITIHNLVFKLLLDTEDTLKINDPKNIVNTIGNLDKITIFN